MLFRERPEKNYGNPLQRIYTQHECTIIISEEKKQRTLNEIKHIKNARIYNTPSFKMMGALCVK